MYITHCAARDIFGNQAGHNAQPGHVMSDNPESGDLHGCGHLVNTIRLVHAMACPHRPHRVSPGVCSPRRRYAELRPRQPGSCSIAATTWCFESHNAAATNCGGPAPDHFWRASASARGGPSTSKVRPLLLSSCLAAWLAESFGWLGRRLVGCRVSQEVGAEEWGTGCGGQV